MDLLRSTSGNGEDTGIPEDLRCKRSDGKQWRCSAMSMPDKTVCEKHYVQAKKRAANSALRASLKKAKRNSFGKEDVYFERNDDVDALYLSPKPGGGGSSNKHREMYSPETPIRGFSTHSPQMFDNEGIRDVDLFDDNRRSSYTTPPSISYGNNSHRDFSSASLDDNSDESLNSSDEEGGVGLTCHQCQRNDTDRVIWCQKCDKRGYCDSCISKWYPNVPLEEVQRVCPACRGTCNCNLCLRGDNLIKFRIRGIAATNKLQYYHSLLSSILPVIKHIHHEQCFELELEASFHGTKADIPRAKLQADEQMCCNCCRIPITDYHRHCAKCLYDLCLTCCRDLRQASHVLVKEEPVEGQNSESSQDGRTVMKQPTLSGRKFDIAEHYPEWKANSDGSIPCPPNGAGGCSCSSLILTRIFKMNWVAKLMKNVEEMVDGCKLNNDSQLPHGTNDVKVCQFSNREGSNDNFLYCPASQDINPEGFHLFQKHWGRGEPIIVNKVCDDTLSANWDPVVIWRGIRETADEKAKEDNRTVKAIDCLDGSEVDIELGQFIKGYKEGRIHENGWPEMLKLKNWPSPGASEEFLQYQRPEFLSKLPLIEYIHFKWGLLNVAAKLPYYSLQNDVGPKILITYGTYEELGRGDSVTNLHINMRDMVYVLMHTCEVKTKGWQRAKIEKIQKTFMESGSNDIHVDAQMNCTEGGHSLESGLNGLGQLNNSGFGKSDNEDKFMDMHMYNSVEVTCSKQREVELKSSITYSADKHEKARVGATWDVFRRQDVPKLIEYLVINWKELRKPSSLSSESATHPLFDQAVYLSQDHKKKLKEDFGIEPWTFEQHVGEAVVIPSGCPFQLRNLQSSVQLVLDFLSPESLEECLRIGQEIRSLPSNHKAKSQILEVGKMSLYAASSAVKDVQKLVLDPKMGPELGWGDPNLTALVSENLEKIVKRREIACS